MNANDLPVWLQVSLLLAPSASAVVALLAFLFSVWNGAKDKRDEGSRRDWERLQQLAQILHNGTSAGVWAQKLAVEELSQLTSKKTQALLLANEALEFWQNTGSPGSQILEDKLHEVILKLSSK